ncbi:MAG: glutathione S-transferase N-terminal domain-containing protein [Gammaproteobacteria bacterium]|nr:glutathione S-transferase N-terminal domain-containing protein [Gammaproteobacteria bacterium]
MKLPIRLFFKTVRFVVGPILLVMHWITTPRGIVRNPAAQHSVDAAARQLVLYKFRTCPFCLKVQRECKRLSLNIETRDAQHNVAARQEILQATGKVQVPCLKILNPDNSVRWMSESNAIIAYLQGQFANQAELNSQG